METRSPMPSQSSAFFPIAAVVDPRVTTVDIAASLPAFSVVPDCIQNMQRRMRDRRHQSRVLERPFAHLYETGGMRRVYLRGHTNILKRLLIHIGGFNLGLLMRQLIGVGTPRGLQGRLIAIVAR